MFDIGFWELALIAVVALLVIGPERLPGVARTAGMWVGRLRRFVGTVKADIDREIKADQLKQILDQQAKLTELQEIIEEPVSAAKSGQAKDYLVKALGKQEGGKSASAGIDQDASAKHADDASK